MFKLITKLFASATMLAALTTGRGLSAQFPGDVYFADPAVTVPIGGVAELAIDAYLGSSPLGAIHLHVEFDAGSAEVVGFDGPTDAALQDNFGQVTQPGRFSAVLFNGKSGTAPIGTVRLGVLRLKPSVGVGQSVALQIRVQTMLDASTTPFAQSQGFRAVVSVSSPNNTLRSSSRVTQLALHELPATWQRWVSAMRRPGAEVLLEVPRWLGGWVEAAYLRVRIPPLSSIHEDGKD